MKGLHEAAKDPRLLAKLMEDLNNPEMMAQAKKMMQNSDWKDEMRKLEKEEQTNQLIRDVDLMLKDTESTQKAIENKLKESDEKSLKLQTNYAVDKALQLAETTEGLQALKEQFEASDTQANLEKLMKTKQFKDFYKNIEQSDELKERFAKVQADFNKL